MVSSATYGCCSRSRTAFQMISSGTKCPAAMCAAPSCSAAELCAVTPRNMSPVDRCTNPSARASSLDCVPLPEHGGPATATSRAGPGWAEPVRASRCSVAVGTGGGGSGASTSAKLYGGSRPGGIGRGTSARRFWAASAAAAISSTVRTGCAPIAASPDNITASAPSQTAVATSLTSDRCGTGLVIIDSIICVATMTG